jgi:hypothetical protein
MRNQSRFAVRGAIAAGALAALLGLTGCVAYPVNEGYYGAPAVAPGYVYAPAPTVVIGGGWGRGWGHGWGHRWR